MTIKISNEYLDALGEVDGESARAREALVEYAKMERRSLAELCKLYARKSSAPTKRLSTLKQWSTQFKWQDRVKNVDIVKAEYEFEEWNRRRKSLNEMAWEQSLWIRKNAFGRIKKIDAATDDKVLILNYARLVKALLEMDSMQRLAVNEPTSIIGIPDNETLDRYIEANMEGSATAGQAKAGGSFESTER